MSEDSQTRWVVGTVGALLILALTSLAALDRSRIASDALEALARSYRLEQEHAVLRAEVMADLKAMRAQLAQIETQQNELLLEMRRRR